MNAKLLLVEDELDIRTFISLHLTRQGYDVRSVDNGEEASQILETENFQLLILDWMLPGISGLELCKKLKGRIPVLMVTARADTQDIVKGLENGADDYLTKPFEIPVLLARVSALLRRAQFIKEPLNSKRLQIGEVVLDIDAHEVTCQQDKLDLTQYEFKILLVLMKNPGRAFSRENLIDLVQGEQVNVIGRTIDTHVFGLRKKLGPCADIIETIRGVGYRIAAPTPS